MSSNLSYPLADVILKRTETPGKTIPPGIDKIGNFFGILTTSADILKQPELLSDSRNNQLNSGLVQRSKLERKIR